MKETDRFIYNSIKEAENKMGEISCQNADLMTRLFELNTETDEVKSQLDINGEIGEHYDQLIKSLKSLLVEDYESIEKEMEKEETGEKKKDMKDMNLAEDKEEVESEIDIVSQRFRYCH